MSQVLHNTHIPCTRRNMAKSLLFVTFVFAAYVMQESRSEAALTYQVINETEDYPSIQKTLLTQGSKINEAAKSARRLMIGSTAPRCTYNECRGCRYKCRAEQVPVEGNDPINSAYHYRCVCHR